MPEPAELEAELEEFEGLAEGDLAGADGLPVCARAVSGSAAATANAINVRFMDRVSPVSE